MAVTVDTDGDAGDETGVVVATDGHPFWVEEQDRWVEAEGLQSGDALRTPAGKRIVVRLVGKRVPGSVGPESNTQV